jgi:hypothetical protein
MRHPWPLKLLHQLRVSISNCTIIAPFNQLIYWTIWSGPKYIYTFLLVDKVNDNDDSGDDVILLQQPSQSVLHHLRGMELNTVSYLINITMMCDDILMDSNNTYFVYMMNVMR